MSQATRRLGIAHSSRKVYFILAVGLKWMPFVWDPTIPAQTPIYFLDHNKAERWQVDPGVKMIPEASLLGQRHIKRHINPSGKSRLIVDKKWAYSLGYWTRNMAGIQVNLGNLQLFEKMFTLIQTTRFLGVNNHDC